MPDTPFKRVFRVLHMVMKYHPDGIQCTFREWVERKLGSQEQGSGSPWHFDLGFTLEYVRINEGHYKITCHDPAAELWILMSVKPEWILEMS